MIRHAALALGLMLGASPVRAGAAVNVTELGRTPIANPGPGGWFDGLFVRDNLAFFLERRDVGGGEFEPWLHIWDVGDPASPVRLAETPFPILGPIPDMHGVYASNGLLYVGVQGGQGGFLIWDVADPSRPRQVSYTPVIGGVHNLRLAGSHLYIAVSSTADVDLRVFDVSDPTAPRAAGRFDIDPGNSYCHDVSVMDGVAYASMWEDGMHLLDVRDPTRNPLPTLSASPTGANTHSVWPTTDLRHAVTCHEEWEMGCSVWDLATQPAAFLANFQSHENTDPAEPNTIAHDVMVVGDFAYITYYNEGLRILDLTDPASPVEAGSLLLSAPCAGFCSAIAQWIEDGIVYVLDMPTGLHILRFDLPHDAPITMRATKAVGAAADVAIGWNHTGESQYTVRTRRAKETMAGLVNRDVDGATRFVDPGAVAGAPGIVYYTLNGAWR